MGESHLKQKLIMLNQIKKLLNEEQVTESEGLKAAAYNEIIKDKLFLGKLASIKDNHLLNQVDAIVTVINVPKMKLTPLILPRSHFHINIDDKEEENIEPYLEKAFNFIESTIKAQG